MFLGIGVLLAGDNGSTYLGRGLLILGALGFVFQLWKMQNQRLSELVSEEKSAKRRVHRRTQKTLTQEYRDQQGVSKSAHDSRQQDIAGQSRLKSAELHREVKAHRQESADRQSHLASEWLKLPTDEIESRLIRLLSSIGNDLVLVEKGYWTFTNHEGKRQVVVLNHSSQRVLPGELKKLSAKASDADYELVWYVSLQGFTEDAVRLSSRLHVVLIESFSLAGLEIQNHLG